MLFTDKNDPSSSHNSTDCGWPTVKKFILRIMRLKRNADDSLGIFSRFLQFCIVGGSGMVVDLSFFTLFLRVEIPVPIARFFAMWIALTWNFFWNRRVTFVESREGGLLRQYLKFCLSCSLGAAINWGLSVGLIYLLPTFAFHYQVCAVAGIVAGTASNFAFSHWWVFKTSQLSSEDKEDEPETGTETAIEEEQKEV